uniref:AA_TRNA_LIGASE_II domain-containing protein n=1 Tax=Elaeophora elaphi TaxID=1147741 RepID=A0A0R3RR48_9BILA
MLVYKSFRSVTHLACRFCNDESAVHVVDPLLDLRYRFKNMEELKCMMEARRLKVDVESVAANYYRWWDIYTKWRDSSVESHAENMSRDRELRQRMLNESEGLLDTLRLPNDLSACTLRSLDVVPSISKVDGEQKSKYMFLLQKAGMIKVEPSLSNAHLVGLPANLQCFLQKLFREEVTGNVLNVSPPHFVRGAIIDGVNMSKENFPVFAGDAHKRSLLYLTGHSIPSLVALFVKKSLVLKTNKWPLRLISSGASYGIPGSIPSSMLNLNNISQRSKTIVLSLCRTQEEEDNEYKSLIKSLQAILANKLSLEIISSMIPAYKLLNFESAATGLSISSGIEVVRICTIGSYISRRLCILLDIEPGSVDFVRMVFVDIDLTRIVASMIERRLISGESLSENIHSFLVRSLRESSNSQKA